METGIKGIYHPYCEDPTGFSFDIELEKNLFIRCDNIKTEKERDEKSKKVAKDLGIILTTSYY